MRQTSSRGINTFISLIEQSGNLRYNCIQNMDILFHSFINIVQMQQFAASEIQKRTGTDFHLIAMKAQDWNRDLSPWPAPAVFGKESFGDGASRTLEEVLKQCADPGKNYIIGGYSLAGLFAIWASYQTDVFSAVSAASPSIWFPDFADYMKGNKIHASAVYLSLGDKEEKARNPVMAAVGSRIREAHEWLKDQGVDTILEWNQGNHFKEADIRTAKAFAWALER